MRTKISLIVGSILFFMSLVFLFVYLWVLSRWSNLSMDEIIFQLSAPLAGTGTAVISSVILRIVAPTIIVGILICLLDIFATKYLKVSKLKMIAAASFVMSFSIVGGVIYSVWNWLELSEYLEAKDEISDFIDNNYVWPEDSIIRFPDDKRNLIYIYLESMEITFSDVENGGAFPENNIPDLTKIGLNNNCFNGRSNRLNGAEVLDGTGWTTAAMVAQTTGLPLKADTELLQREGQFYPNVVSLGDILDNAGYHNYLLIGSDATFGSRELYFTEHGNYDIWDLDYALEHQWIDKRNEFWGFNDNALFGFAKERLAEISKDPEPFNLTLLTVDTHAEDGDVCDQCMQVYGDQYANVVACSDRQVASFVEWLQGQDFYENTTIIISGDHTTMDSDFCDKVDPDYNRRVFTTIINSNVNICKDDERDYSTFDLFPTTLAALNFGIDGDRLGLGTNLFSCEDTLTEIYGKDYENVEISKHSMLMDELSKYKIDDSMVNMLDFDYEMNKAGYLTISIIDKAGIMDGFPEVFINVESKNKSKKIKCKKNKDGFYFARLNVIGFDDDISVSCEMSVGDSERIEKHIADKDLGLIKHSKDMDTYLNFLSNSDDYIIFISGYDSVIGALRESTIQELSNLGLKTQMDGTLNRLSYVALVDGDRVIEDFGEKKISLEGKIDEHSYKVESGGYSSGADSSIMIDDVEYSLNMRGFNIVVMDRASYLVIDSKNYDTVAEY